METRMNLLTSNLLPIVIIFAGLFFAALILWRKGCDPRSDTEKVSGLFFMANNEKVSGLFFWHATLFPQ